MINTREALRELGVMRQKVEREKRNPTDAEKSRANFLMDVIDMAELRDMLELRGGPTDKGFLSGEGHKRNIEKSEFNSMGDYLSAVMKAGIDGQKTDERLYRAASGLNESVPSDGGFLLPQDHSMELMKGVWNTGVLAPMCRRVEITRGNSISLPAPDETSRADGARWGGILAYWANEAAEKTKSKPNFRSIELNLKKLIGLCYATDELLEDVNLLEQVVREGFADEFGFKVDTAIFSGSGAGQPAGILNAPAMIQVNKESGQPADTIVYENVMKMWIRLLPQSRKNAVWLINSDAEAQLYSMSLSIGTGGVPVYMPAGGASSAPYATLYGRPVIPIEQCETLGDSGDIVLADFRNGYVLAEKGGMKSDMSIHVRYVYDESVFRFVLRIDGQPFLASAVTPYNSSQTQSHFVKLQART